MRAALLSFALFALWSAACGIRHEARPPTNDGYKSVAVRDISAVGMRDVNVEVVGMLGPMVSQEVCKGLITFPLMDVRSPSLGGISLSMSGVTLSLPRSRYNEIRDLHSGDPVRVRGYLSKYFAQGCDWEYLDASRALWIDTIETVTLP
jgi:hypothetical protein